MKFLYISIRVFVFAAALLLGTTGVIASRFAVSTIANIIKPAAIAEVAGQESIPETTETEPTAEFLDLRPATLEAPAAEDFDPTETYYLEADAPAAFTDIESIDITSREHSYENGTHSSTPIIPKGSLQTTKAFTFTKISVGNREVAFQTETIGGISYKFVGHFPVLNEWVNCDECEHPGNLTGKLTKIKDGKVVAELNAKYYVSGC